MTANLSDPQGIALDAAAEKMYCDADHCETDGDASSRLGRRPERRQQHRQSVLRRRHDNGSHKRRRPLRHGRRREQCCEAGGLSIADDTGNACSVASWARQPHSTPVTRTRTTTRAALRGRRPERRRRRRHGVLPRRHRRRRERRRRHRRRREGWRRGGRQRRCHRRLRNVLRYLHVRGSHHRRRPLQHGRRRAQPLPGRLDDNKPSHQRPSRHRMGCHDRKDDGPRLEHRRSSGALGRNSDGGPGVREPQRPSRHRIGYHGRETGIGPTSALTRSSGALGLGRGGGPGDFGPRRPL